MLHTIYAAKFGQTIIHQHVHLRPESQSHAPAHVLMRLYAINKSIVCSQRERRTSCQNNQLNILPVVYAATSPHTLRFSCVLLSVFWLQRYYISLTRCIVEPIPLQNIGCLCPLYLPCRQCGSIGIVPKLSMSTLVSVSTVRSNNNLDIYFHGDSGITFYDRSRWRVKISLQMSKLKMTFHLDKTVLLHMIIHNKNVDI